MKLDLIRDEIKLKLTGGVLDLELDDTNLDKIINAAFREVQRYINSTKIVKLVFKPCLDLSSLKVSSVVTVRRTQGYLSGDPESDGSQVDPMYVAQWQLLSGLGGTGLNISNFGNNYAAWNTSLQIKNTMSTDLNFIFDKATSYLYINAAFDKPKYVSVTYIPRFDSVEEIVSDYWIDIIIKMATALTKITLGNVRGKFTQTNALWTLDAEKMSTEGREEYQQLIQYLQDNNLLIYPKD